MERKLSPLQGAVISQLADDRVLTTCNNSNFHSSLPKLNLKNNRIVMKKFTTFLLQSSCYFHCCRTVNSEETRDVKGFTKISYGISGNLTIKIGSEFSVVLEGEKGDLREVITEVSDGKLRIRQDSWFFNFNSRVNAYVTLPQLTGLNVSGSGKAEILDPIKDADNLSLSVSGSKP